MLIIDHGAQNSSTSKYSFAAGILYAAFILPPGAALSLSRVICSDTLYASLLQRIQKILENNCESLRNI
jgi:hypothetical protein